MKCLGLPREMVNHKFNPELSKSSFPMIILLSFPLIYLDFKLLHATNLAVRGHFMYMGDRYTLCLLLVGCTCLNPRYVVCEGHPNILVVERSLC